MEKPDDTNNQQKPCGNRQDISAQQHPESPMIDPPTSNLPAHEEEWRKEQKRNWERQRRIGTCGNWITGIAAAVGLLGLYAIYDQANSTRIAAMAAKDQAASAKIAADLAKDGFDETAKTFRLEQRAWLLPSEHRIRESPGKLHLEFHILNSGRVPASIVGAKFELANAPLAQCPPIKENFEPYGLPISPNGQKWLGLSINERAIQEQVRQSESVYVYGQVNYTDTFPGTKHSCFCSIFHPMSGVHEICPFCNTYD